MAVRLLPNQAALSAHAKWKLLRWSIMIAMVFWTLVYRLGLDKAQLPEFVYVNF